MLEIEVSSDKDSISYWNVDSEVKDAAPMLFLLNYKYSSFE